MKPGTVGQLSRMEGIDPSYRSQDIVIYKGPS